MDAFGFPGPAPTSKRFARPSVVTLETQTDVEQSLLKEGRPAIALCNDIV